MVATLSPIVGTDGKPFVKKSSRKDAATMQQESNARIGIRATYDAASNSTEYSNYWANSDNLDADSSNSRSVRQKLVSRSRYEVANNGFSDGIVQTYATDLVGTGPKLQMQTGSPEFNQAVETVWWQWSRAIQLRRKLWTMAHAKVQDGEAFAIARTNPRVRHPIKLDVALIETEQCQSPNLPWAAEGYIDGVKFDSFGNPESYEVLKYHPNGTWASYANSDVESVPAKFVMHWYLLRRPGQHRGVPEFRSTLNAGAAARRWREATIAAAETAADFSVLMKTTLDAEQIDSVSPMSSLDIQKRMMTALPMGYDAMQMKAEHPSATYEAFHKTLINEQARPKSMPYNKAACDSSSYNYASGRLDHQTYYGGLDVEREDENDLVLDPLFFLFWEEAVDAYGWNADPDLPPSHTWDHPKHPVADLKSESDAMDKKLRNGSLSLSQLYSDNGADFEDELPRMARDYGVSEERMREILVTALFNSQNQQASMASVTERVADVEDTVNV